MALVLKDRVKQTTATTGTGTLTLSGTVTGFNTFSVIGDGNTTYYAIVNTLAGEWEVGYGTYTAAGATLTRTTVLESSNGNALVNFSAGSKDVFVTYPAEKAVSLDASDNVVVGGNITATTFFGELSGNAATATSATTATALATARSIGLTGDVSGSANFDGSANISITATVADDSHNHVISNVDGLQTALDAKAPLASPALTGVPTAPTAVAGTNTTQIATTSFVSTAVANLVDAAPATLDTLNELAAALGDDPNFATTVSTSLGTKAPLASPALTGTPTAPTAAVGTNTTQLATTAFVNSEIANDAPTKTGGGASGTWGIDITGSSGSTTGNATTATTLQTARTIALSGAATGTATSFDGGANITIPVTALNASNLSSGTVPDARISGSYTGMTNLTGSGTVDFAKFLGNAADTAAAPSISWTGDTNTGIYRPAADQVGITTGGTDRFSVSTTDVTSTLPITATNLYPPTDNTGVVGSAALTWSNGQFTNLSVDSTLTVRGAVDLADSDILRMGSSDDWALWYNGSTNKGQIEMEAACNGIQFTNNGTQVGYFDKDGVMNVGNGIYENSATIATSYTITTGSNGMSAGPITINSGVTVTVPSGSAWTVV